MKPLTASSFWPLWIGASATLISGVLSFTPLAWNLMGRPDETYPELFFLAYCFLPSVLLLVGGVVHALFVLRRRDRDL